MKGFDLEILSQNECTLLVDQIFNLRKYWQQVNASLDFHTLGAAAYLYREESLILQHTQALNPIMLSNFKWLYERLKTILEDFLQEPVNYQNAFALPGFNVYFLTPQLLQEQKLLAHFDVNYRRLNWSAYQHSNFSRPISLTLALEIPSGGTGIEIWDVDMNDVTDHQGQIPPIEVLANKYPKTYIPYQLGWAHLRFGHPLHAVAKILPKKSDLKLDCQRRITLQLHAIKCDRVWQLYW